MGRKPNKPAALNAGAVRNLRHRFLEATNRVCPEVVESLKEVGRGGRDFDEWAKTFGIVGTWVEQTAQCTLEAWKHSPAFEQESGWVQPVVARSYPYGYPDFLRMRQWMHSFHVSTYLFSPEAQKPGIHAALDQDLKDIERWAASEGLTVPGLIPKDPELDKKLECAALYLYRGWTLDQVRDQDGYRTTRANMSAWIRQTLELLSIPMGARRRRAH